MVVARRVNPVKLIIGLIFREETILNKAESLLERKFGKIDLYSPILAFNYTDYYEKEFGKGLKRIFISFKKPIPHGSLPKIKLFTKKVEKKLSKGPNRTINIDPGYIDLARLILASTKDYSHRIYAGKGIYSEVTLLYKDKSFRPLDWTYPDYRTQEYIAIFNEIREIYAGRER